MTLKLFILNDFKPNSFPPAPRAVQIPPRYWPSRVARAHHWKLPQKASGRVPCCLSTPSKRPRLPRNYHPPPWSSWSRRPTVSSRCLRARQCGLRCAHSRVQFQRAHRHTGCAPSRRGTDAHVAPSEPRNLGAPSLSKLSSSQDPARRYTHIPWTIGGA